MANIYGRSVIVILVNKTGLGVIAGDVVVPDGSNDGAFTTTTSASTTSPVWVVQETIASNASGRVLIGGYAALVNVQASVTRGHYGATYTVAKQATDGGASRTAGTFCRFLTGGTTPTAEVYPTDLLGSSLTNPMSHVGAVIIGGTAGAPTELVVGAAGKVLKSDGTNPGYSTAGEFASDAATVATDESSNATSYGNLTTTGPAVTVTIGASGKAMVTVGAFTYPSGTSHGHYMGFAVSGATTTAAADATAYQNDGGSGAGGNHASLRSLVTGLAAGSTTFTAKYRVDNSGDTAHWSMRTIIVEPVL